MKRMLVVALASASVLTIASAAMAATHHAKAPAHVQAVFADAGRCTDPASCTGACKPGHGRAAVAKAPHSGMAASGSCSDPSQCPQWCRPNAGATSASAKHTDARMSRRAANAVMAGKIETR